jgi:hypothetical protein
MTSNPNEVPQSGTVFLYLLKERSRAVSDFDGPAVKIGD